MGPKRSVVTSVCWGFACGFPSYSSISASQTCTRSASSGPSMTTLNKEESLDTSIGFAQVIVNSDPLPVELMLRVTN
ncbi:hypothetical protein PR003_g28202 [Phytophthora rubi]|uniref:Uncharacterized protein n=1 Tax=Phytophthora rubi TaxID=129364 RepID=A0A6A3HQW2_9STRA|nr:hypothetical protein PR001_g27007 [Phytophthora rubi]KAE8971630.1 hypothetical protein PR002_g26765 [Phytophthora rubi]KAE9279569.1 hypothetical protein PR003_g28202 [Phytophthora rubi]